MRRAIICHDVYKKKYRVSVEKLKFRPSVYGLVIEKGKILLSKQGDGYDFPGGAIEIDENLNEALKREFFEETGLKIKILDLIDCKSSFFKFRFDDIFVNSILIYFQCKIVGGKISTKNLSEYENIFMEKPEWIELKNIKSIKFYNSVNSVQIINKALNLIN